MAVRRMLHGEILKSDSFLSLPFSAQMLYVQITMNADDDGFFNGAERLRRLIGAKTKDLKLLAEKRFLLDFGGIVVVKHWRMANSLKNDRLKPLVYPEIAKKIYIKPNRVYTDHREEGYENLFDYKQMQLSKGASDGIRLESQEKRKEKKRTERNRTEDEGEGFPAAAAQSENLKVFGGKLGKGVLMLTEAQTTELLDRMGIECFDAYAEKIAKFIQQGGYVKNHYATMLKWWREDRQI